MKNCCIWDSVSIPAGPYLLWLVMFVLLGSVAMSDPRLLTRCESCVTRIPRITPTQEEMGDFTRFVHIWPILAHWIWCDQGASNLVSWRVSYTYIYILHICNIYIYIILLYYIYIYIILYIILYIYYILSIIYYILYIIYYILYIIYIILYIYYILSIIYYILYIIKLHIYIILHIYILYYYYITYIYILLYYIYYIILLCISYQYIYIYLYTYYTYMMNIQYPYQYPYVYIYIYYTHSYIISTQTSHQELEKRAKLQEEVSSELCGVHGSLGEEIFESYAARIVMDSPWDALKSIFIIP